MLHEGKIILYQWHWNDLGKYDYQDKKDNIQENYKTKEIQRLVWTSECEDNIEC
jgi:hypothetical protein